MSIPKFAVVGRPNKGKSSLVATLARDDSVKVEQRAGSTKHSRAYPMQVNGITLYEIIDTPGFQRARSVFEWLEKKCANATDRADTVRRFVEYFAADSRFRAELELLTPIMDGAGIIYVVDGSTPFSVDYETEMEILRWTGKPRLAIINPIDNQDFVEEWRSALDQYFSTIRVFNPHREEQVKQLELLELFGHLDPDWQSSLKSARKLLESDTSRQQHEVAQLIAHMVIEVLSYSTVQKVPEGTSSASRDTITNALAEQYRIHVTGLERKCRDQVEQVYAHNQIERSEAELAFDQRELFNTDDWYLWGIGKLPLAIVSAWSGSVVGSGAGFVIAAIPGGVTAPLGAAFGAVAGAAVGASGAIFFPHRIAKIKVKGIPAGGKILRYGPVTNENFPFVLLTRAIVHHRMVSARTHAQRGDMDLKGLPAELYKKHDRKFLAKGFRFISKGKDLDQQESLLCDWIMSQG